MSIVHDWLTGGRRFEVIEVEELFPIGSVDAMELIHGFLSNRRHLADHECEHRLTTIVDHTDRRLVLQQQAGRLAPVYTQKYIHEWLNGWTDRPSRLVISSTIDQPEIRTGLLQILIL